MPGDDSCPSGVPDRDGPIRSQRGRPVSSEKVAAAVSDVGAVATLNAMPSFSS